MSAVKETKQALSIVRYGHPALREKAQRIGRVTTEVKELVSRMVELMRASHGLGLAANQVGVVRRVAVVEVEGKLVPLVDPELVSAKGSESVDEGCLSLPRLYGDVERPTQVVVKAKDLAGKTFKLRAEGLLARALCHELDHLNGTLFVDKVDQSTLHWLVGETSEGELLTQPTTLEEALKVFVAAKGMPPAGGRNDL